MTRFGYVMVTYFAVMGVVIASLVPVPLRLIWNASASAPIGSDLDPAHHPAVTDLVAVGRTSRSPTSWSSAAISVARAADEARHGAAGQRVCRTGLAITVDGCRSGVRSTAIARPPAAGLAGLPPYRRRRLFLMNPDVRDSLDGRFRPDPGARRHRQGHAALHRRGRRWPLRLARRHAATASIDGSGARRSFPTPPPGDIMPRSVNSRA
jgi:type IV secretory pathway protease TraF